LAECRKLGHPAGEHRELLPVRDHPLAKTVPLFVGEIGPTLTLGSDGIDQNCPRSAIVDGGFAATTLA
jgi:hypothetical protein